MDSNKLDDFISSAALLAAHLTRQCEAAAARQQQAALDLGEAASGLTRRVADSRTDLVGSVTDVVRASMTGEVEAANLAIVDGTQRLQCAAAHFEQARHRLDVRMKWIGGATTVLIAAGAILLLLVTGHLARQNIERAQRANVQADVLEALEQVAITSCDGAPCIKLQAGLPRWAGNTEYVLVEPVRPVP